MWQLAVVAVGGGGGQQVQMSRVYLASTWSYMPSGTDKKQVGDLPLQVGDLPRGVGKID